MYLQLHDAEVLVTQLVRAQGHQNTIYYPQKSSVMITVYCVLHNICIQDEIECKTNLP